MSGRCQSRLRLLLLSVIALKSAIFDGAKLDVLCAWVLALLGERS